LILSNEEIVKLLDNLDSEARAIKEEALRMAWFMRGGISYEDIMYTSKDERVLIAEIVENNMKQTKESGLPFF
jgi:hypothetical protein